MVTLKDSVGVVPVGAKGPAKRMVPRVVDGFGQDEPEQGSRDRTMDTS